MRRHIYVRELKLEANFDFSREHVYQSLLCPSVNASESALSADFGVTHKSQTVGERAKVESAKYEAQLCKYGFAHCLIF